MICRVYEIIHDDTLSILCSQNYLICCWQCYKSDTFSIIFIYGFSWVTFLVFRSSTFRSIMSYELLIKVRDAIVESWGYIQTRSTHTPPPPRKKNIYSYIKYKNTMYIYMLISLYIDFTFHITVLFLLIKLLFIINRIILEPLRFSRQYYGHHMVPGSKSLSDAIVPYGKEFHPHSFIVPR